MYFLHLKFYLRVLSLSTTKVKHIKSYTLIPFADMKLKPDVVVAKSDSHHTLEIPDMYTGITKYVYFVTVLE